MRHMATLTMSPPAGKILTLPTRQEVRQLMDRTPIVITVIVCSTLAFLATIAAVAFLAYTGNDTAVIGAVIVGALVPVLSILLSRTRAIETTLQQQQQQQQGVDNGS
jgi:hypothetical protein